MRVHVWRDSLRTSCQTSEVHFMRLNRIRQLFTPLRYDGGDYW